MPNIVIRCPTLGTTVPTGLSTEKINWSRCQELSYGCNARMLAASQMGATRGMGSEGANQAPIVTGRQTHDVGRASATGPPRPLDQALPGILPVNAHKGTHVLLPKSTFRQRIQNAIRSKRCLA